MKSIIKLLQNNKSNSVWGHALRNAHKEDFKLLIDSIKSQAYDNPTMMKQIIGEKCFNLIINYK